MITSSRNARIKWVRTLQTRRRARQREQAFVIEGVRLAREALTAKASLKMLLHTQQMRQKEPHLIEAMTKLAAEVHPVSDHVMQSCSDLESPPGLLAVLPHMALPLPPRLTLALIVDRMNNPGNLGTLLRSADASGVQAVFLTDDTVDAYNPKVVRGAMGAHFRTPIVSTPVANLSEYLRGLETWLAEAKAGERYDQVDWSHPLALLIGGEARGPSKQVRALASGSVHIPMRAGRESLNAAVAASVILFEINRQRG
ncbi:MAG: RNA methyltransferase [Anaerolineales bacterium]|jgi:TrmH family RNA methyltransferase